MFLDQAEMRGGHETETVTLASTIHLEEPENESFLSLRQLKKLEREKYQGSECIAVLNQEKFESAQNWYINLKLYCTSCKIRRRSLGLSQIVEDPEKAIASFSKAIFISDKGSC